MAGKDNCSQVILSIVPDKKPTWLHLLMTVMPVPLARAGGLTIHFARQPRFSQTRRSSLVSAGRQKVRGKKLNSSFPNFKRSRW